MNFREALQYLGGLVDYERLTGYRPAALDPDGLRRYLARRGHPDRRYRVLHVAGTKGKGSTAVMAASVLRAAGYRVGLFTSPHLHSVTERVMIDLRPLAEDRFAAGIDRLRSAWAEPTYFEALAGLALEAFAAAGVDFAVVEAGLGGRHDATNALKPDVCALSPISLDHVAVLGDTVQAVAAEKAGIIKPGAPVVSAPQRPGALEVIARAAEAAGVSLQVVGRDYLVERKGDRFDIAGPAGTYRGLFVPLPGAHQTENAALAVAAVEAALAKAGSSLEPERLAEAVRRGLAGVRWPGRFEVIPGRPSIVLDGAHNADSAARLREALGLVAHRRLVLVFGAGREKDVAGMFDELAPQSNLVVLTSSGHPRAASPRELAAHLEPFPVSRLEVAAPALALQAARDNSAPEDLILVTGSLHLVARVREVLGLPW